MQIALMVLIAVALGYLALRVWRWRKGQDAMGRSLGFRPRIGFTRQDGMASVALLLTNGPGEQVWVEEIEISLTDLVANDQIVEPSLHEIQKIRQVVRPQDTLPISLAHAIYKAAGNPQRRYACVLSSVLRYRIGEEWSEKTMDNHKIRMAGLIALGMDRGRKSAPPFPPQNKSPQNAPAVPSKLK